MSTDPSRRSHLTHISTLWSVVLKAHCGDPAVAASSQAKLIERYAPAVHRYLLAVLRDDHAADEVFQEFAVRLLRGGFAGADPRRGRFRDYLKTAITHLVADHRRQDRRRRHEQPLEPLDALPGRVADDDPQGLFVRTWREELLSRAWDALAEHEFRTKQPWFQVLRLRTEHPMADSAALAKILSEHLKLQKPLTAVNTRKLLERARQRFAEALVDEVQQSLSHGSLEDVEQELIDLALHRHCRSALRRRRGAAAPADPIESRHG